MPKLDAKMKITLMQMVFVASVVPLGVKTSIGWLIEHFGLTNVVAWTIVSLLASDGMGVVTMLYPFLLPFTGTLYGVLFVFGAAAVAGW